MDSYDPNFDPESYDPNHTPHLEDHGAAGYDPDMNYIHNEQALPPESSPHGGHDNTNNNPNDTSNINYDPHYDDTGMTDDIPRHVGEGYSDDDMDDSSYNDGFGDDDDVYADNIHGGNNNNASYEIESHDPKDGMPDAFLRNCMITCTCIFLLSGIIVLAIRINRVSDDDAAKRTVHMSSVGLVPPPAELAQKCTSTNVLSEKGFFECEELCEAADCCNYPTTLALSCLSGHDDECLIYHRHCNVLQLDQGSLVNPPSTPENLPEAPRDIESKCNIESLRTVPGFEACVNDCMQAECCWKKDSSVHPCPKQEVCQGYAPCLAMDAADHIDDSSGGKDDNKITKEIDTKCADDQLATEVGRNSCIFACSQAACCFDPGAQCPHENGHFCTQYESCHKIFDEYGQVIQGGATNPNDVPVAPEFLDTACLNSSLQTLPGYEMCSGACSEAECCWKGDKTCAGDSQCSGYEACVNLIDKEFNGANPETIPEAPEYLAAACSEESLDSSAGFEMCQDACMKAECCWKVSSCSQRPECSEYATNCANLIARLDSDDSSSVPEAPHDLDQTCDADVITELVGYTVCKKACKKAECCWKSGSSDSCVSDTDCQAWSACTVLNGAEEPAAGTTPPQSAGDTTSTGASGSSSDNQQTYSLEQVFDACLNHDNNVGGKHKSLCQIVCQAGNCCYDDTKDCGDDVDCKVFEPCEILHSETSSNVEAACDGSDLAECVGVCADATCCFTNDISKICDVTNPDIICRQYRACEILYSAETSP